MQTNTIPTVSLQLCEYNKAKKTLSLASEYFGMPQQFYVVSHVTGKEFRFVHVGPEDVLYDEDGWDGEMAIYRPVGHCPNVNHMIVYNQY